MIVVKVIVSIFSVFMFLICGCNAVNMRFSDNKDDRFVEVLIGMCFALLAVFVWRIK